MEAPGANPWTFLRSFEGEPRGFWAQGSGWIAHGGVLHEIRVPVGEDREGRGGLDAERFQRVRTAAQAGGETPPERARWFGGFSFGEGHAPDELWAGFPPALFQRPAFELESDGRVVRLTGWATVPEGGRAEAVEEALRQRLSERVRRSRMDAEGEHAPSMSAAAPAPGARGAWTRMVRHALDRIEADASLTKVVLARSVDVSFDGPVDPLAVVRRLYEQNPRARVFLFQPTADTGFAGASPETITRRVRGLLDATAVAGSTRRGESPEEDRRLAHALLASEKDLREQAQVVEDMVERLGRWGTSVEQDPRPSVLSLARIHHLETRIRARVDGDAHVLDVLADLHPTPAVCGRERDEAFRFLVAEEDFDRGWYGGPVGWFDGAGNGMFVPALRCVLLGAERGRLFAGCGIVPGSDPDREWDETRLKLQTALAALT